MEKAHNIVTFTYWAWRPVGLKYNQPEQVSKIFSENLA